MANHNNKFLFAILSSLLLSARLPTSNSATPVDYSGPISDWPHYSGVDNSDHYTRCGTAGCRCHADPPQPHGPNYQWTAKINGKTVTRCLTDREANLYQEWIANDRRMR
jgi:hypothetical protein